MQADPDPMALVPMVKNLSRWSFLYGAPIGLLGGMIGLGGAEFRLPVLAGPLGYPPRQAVSLNLAVTLITLLASLAVRYGSLSFRSLEPFLPVLFSFMVGSVGASLFGTTLAGRVSSRQLEQVIFALLFGIGLVLIVEGFLPYDATGFIPHDTFWKVGAGVLFGMVVGMVCSLLGVAGGELIIPILIWGFGVDIVSAGTASLLISTPMVIVGVIGYAGRGAFAERTHLRETVIPMGLGSLLGAVIGGLLVSVAPAAVVKVALGLILMYSAARVFLKDRSALTILRSPPL